MEEQLIIYILSDSIGETGELIANAAVKQFFSGGYEIRRFPYITTKEQIEDIFKDAKDENALVIYTTVSKENRDYIEEIGEELNIPTVDVMTPPLEALEGLLNISPKRESGIIRRLDENYFRKVEALEFAVKYDDAKDPRGIVKADICLIGVSRTSKTPLSMYLANKNFKVANIPLVPEVTPPKELYEKDKRRVIGLIANSTKLNEIRKERLKALGLDDAANYANIDRIDDELKYAKKIMEDLDCKVIDVSNKAVEETAGIIANYMIETFK